MSDKELKALIELLDDPDNAVFDEIKNKIISIGNDVIPHLEDAWESSLDVLRQERIENIIHHLQFEDVKKALSDWKNSPEKELIQGAIIIAKYQYPDIDEELIHKTINQLKQDTWLELNENLTALEQVNVLNRIFFEIHGFHGNTKNINSPKNSFINNVVESKSGNPITLGILYISVCKLLNIPIFGVNVPAHFVLAYSEKPNNILFYINLFNKGTIFSKYDIDNFLAQLKLSPKASYYIPCDNLTIIQRLIQHLVFTYDNLGYLDKKQELEQLYGILKEQA